MHLEDLHRLLPRKEIAAEDHLDSLTVEWRGFELLYCLLILPEGAHGRPVCFFAHEQHPDEPTLLAEHGQGAFPRELLILLEPVRLLVADIASFEDKEGFDLIAMLNMPRSSTGSSPS
jgi:hypothetical protein